MKKSTIIIIVVVALLAIWGVSGYNGLVTCLLYTSPSPRDA
mgnify:CR=1 FL=1